MRAVGDARRRLREANLPASCARALVLHRWHAADRHQLFPIKQICDLELKAPSEKVGITGQPCRSIPEVWCSELNGSLSCYADEASCNAIVGMVGRALGKQSEQCVRRSSAP